MPGDSPLTEALQRVEAFAAARTAPLGPERPRLRPNFPSNLYAGRVTSFSLRRLRLRSGEQFRDRVEVDLEPFEFGGQRYLRVPERVPAELTVTQASTGTVFELRFHARLHGPCMRCLADAVVDRDVAAREYHATKADSEELASPYVRDDQLDLTAWARDALALGLPTQILCRPDCAGLCPVCGKDLNVEPHVHEEERTDARWAALEALKDRL